MTNSINKNREIAFIEPNLFFDNQHMIAHHIIFQKIRRTHQVFMLYYYGIICFSGRCGHDDTQDYFCGHALRTSAVYFGCPVQQADGRIYEKHEKNQVGDGANEKRLVYHF